MAETMTYDAGTDTVSTSENLTPDEQDSLQVGEAMEEQQEMLKQAGQMMGTPMMDPSKNPGMNQMLKDGYDQLQNDQSEGQSPDEGA